MALMKFRRGNRIERGNHLDKRISCVFVRNEVPCVLRIFRDAFKGLLVLRLYIQAMGLLRRLLARCGVVGEIPIIIIIFAIKLERGRMMDEVRVGDALLYQYLDMLGVQYEYHTHPAAPTVEVAMRYWKDIPGLHCKNLFMRNHKGNHHFLLVAPGEKAVDIHGVERRVSEGKLSFASPRRMQEYLGVAPGSVSPFGVLHDVRHEVFLFLDEMLRDAERISFHPNDNRASLVVSCEGLLRFLGALGNRYEFVDLSKL